MTQNPPCKIILAVGLPGSGKTSYLRGLGVNAISSDEVRRMLADDATDQTLNGRVFQTMRFLLAQRLRVGRPETYIDATSLTRWEREPYVRMARACGAEVEVLYFDVPLETCLERNKGRERMVPDEAIRTMAGKLEPPVLEEGFARITVFKG